MAGVSRTIRRGTRGADLIALFFIAASVSCARYTDVERNLESASYRSLTVDSFIGYVVADGEPRGARTIYTVATRIADQDVSLRVTAPRYPSIKPGTIVDVSGDVSLAQPFSTEGGSVFDYQSFLRARSTVSLVDNASLSETHANAFDSSLRFNQKLYAYVIHVTSRVESVLVTSINSILGRREGALILGMTLGRKDDLDQRAQDDFKESGLMHIVVLSGSNVAIVVAAITSITGRIVTGTGRLSRTARAIIPIVGAWSLVIVSGADPSARRAGFMATVSIASQGNSVSEVQTKNSPRNKSMLGTLLELSVGSNGWRQLAVLTATAGLMALINPYAPRFDPSYGLSFLAAFGVTFIAPIFSRVLRFAPQRFAIRETLAQCLAA